MRVTTPFVLVALVELLLPELLEEPLMPLLLPAAVGAGVGVLLLDGSGVGVPLFVGFGVGVGVLVVVLVGVGVGELAETETNATYDVVVPALPVARLAPVVALLLAAALLLVAAVLLAGDPPLPSTTVVSPLAAVSVKSAWTVWEIVPVAAVAVR